MQHLEFILNLEYINNESFMHYVLIITILYSNAQKNIEASASE